MRSLVVTLATLAALASAAEAQAPADPVPLYENLGSLSYRITTAEAATQRYFDQGLRLLYAFNHAESERAFREAERRDSSCAMCAWGVAMALGPNINAPMDSAAGVAAYAAIQRARGALDRETEAERGLVEALAQRYAPVPPADRAALDSAYARAMSALATRMPGDIEAQVLAADALMNLSPWNYWTKEGQARPATNEILSRLEASMAKNPNHPGACHLFIHAVEAREPAKAVACAERLAELMPGAGHIVHMPGHIYIRVGRYADAIAANRHAVHADESYLEGPYVSQRGIYPQGYYPHNYHFMGFAAAMAGDKKTALYAARKVAEKVGPEVARAHGWLEAITPFLYWTQVTFGEWDAILAEPLPPSDLRFTTGMAYYARGMAFAAKGRWAEARVALDTVQATAAQAPDGDNKTALAIAALSLEGEIALRKGNAKGAVTALTKAAALEDGMVYTEPPTWYYPVRQSLGKALLAAGRPADAERAYREDLDRFPANGWSLFGLAASLERQGKRDEAKTVRAQFQDAWAQADVTITASRF